MSPEIATDGSATQAYCIDDAVRRKFLSGEHYYELYTVTHLAAPDSGWRGPVGHYRLVVDKRATANFVAFGALPARKISPTTFEWTAADFTPGSQTGENGRAHVRTPGTNAHHVFNLPLA